MCLIYVHMHVILSIRSQSLGLRREEDCSGTVSCVSTDSGVALVKSAAYSVAWRLGGRLLVREQDRCRQDSRLLTGYALLAKMMYGDTPLVLQCRGLEGRDSLLSAALRRKGRMASQPCADSRSIDGGHHYLHLLFARHEPQMVTPAAGSAPGTVVVGIVVDAGIAAAEATARFVAECRTLHRRCIPHSRGLTVDVGWQIPGQSCIRPPHLILTRHHWMQTAQWGSYETPIGVRGASKADSGPVDAAQPRT